jgi:uncharacterized damage-inducible protein DinB
MNQTDLAPQIDYLYWLRDRILAQAARLEPNAWTATDTVTSRDLRATLVHELDVELSWRERLRGGLPEDWRDVALAPEDYPTLEALADRWRADEVEMRAWLAALGEDDLAAPVTVNGMWGFPMWVHLLHVLDHGIQSFSEAAVLLSAAGHSPGDLDFLDFYDTPERRAVAAAAP